MDIVVVGPRGCETKIALDDSSGLRAHFSNKTFVKKVLALNFKSQGWKNASLRDDRQRFAEARRQLNLESSEKERQAQEVHSMRQQI